MSKLSSSSLTKMHSSSIFKSSGGTASFGGSRSHFLIFLEFLLELLNLEGAYVLCVYVCEKVCGRQPEFELGLCFAKIASNGNPARRSWPFSE